MIAHQRVSGRKRGPPEAFNPLLDGRSDTERNRPFPLALAGPSVLPSGHLVVANGEADTTHILVIVGVVAGPRLQCPFCVKTYKNRNVLGTHVSREHRAAAGRDGAAAAAAAGDSALAWTHVDSSCPVKVTIQPEPPAVHRCALIPPPPSYLPYGVRS